MKKFTLLSAALTLVLIAAGLFLSSGFEKRTDVHLQDFSLSKDGSVITIKTALSGSMGFIRNMKTETIGRELHCSFYSAFGGLNSSIGAKNRFEIKLTDSIEKVHFDRGDRSDALVLKRDASTNKWTQM